ncbi:hypothetical protein N9Y60_04155 [Crocinitomicaceae bacterium]|nr:hypothetical protein [Crocinitomicaceae bacterium]MDB3907084.1 hypothetical protein [Crocinitomicaceae bacterium]
MEKFVSTVFYSIFQTKRAITTTEKVAVVASVVFVTLITAYVMLSFTA